jgi:hypothetical protein
MRTKISILSIMSISLILTIVTIGTVSAITATDNVTILTDKQMYNKGEIVNFTIYNKNPSSIEIDFKWSVLDNKTGNCIWGCVWAAVYNPIIVHSGGSHSWTWNQQSENGTAYPGYYKGVLHGYYSNVFEIADTDAMLVYYRGLGKYPGIVETSDLLKAADDWINDTVPPGFSVSITSPQLLALADEWRHSQL